MSADRDKIDDALRRSEELHKWFRMICRVASKEIQIDLLRTRFARAETQGERTELRTLLICLLEQTDRFDEALQVSDDWIAKNPDDVYGYTWKSQTYISLHDLDNALACADLAVACALRTRKWLRMALGRKARILVDMRDRDALAVVLEEIMAVKVDRGTVDMGRERDFVDSAPAGLIPRDLRLRFDAFCPRRKGDTPGELARFDTPDFGPDGEEVPVTRPR